MSHEAVCSSDASQIVAPQKPSHITPTFTHRGNDIEEFSQVSPVECYYISLILVGCILGVKLAQKMMARNGETDIFQYAGPPAIPETLGFLVALVSVFFPKHYEVRVDTNQRELILSCGRFPFFLCPNETRVKLDDVAPAVLVGGTAMSEIKGFPFYESVEMVTLLVQWTVAARDESGFELTETLRSAVLAVCPKKEAQQHAAGWSEYLSKKRDCELRI